MVGLIEHSNRSNDSQGEYMTPLEKREEIINLANELNTALEKKSDEGLLREGGNLLLGRYYAESPIIYFGLNPGSIDGDMPFVPHFDEKSGRNPPFDSSDDFSRGLYGRKWKQFLGGYPLLYDWFNNKVTSTFLC